MIQRFDVGPRLSEMAIHNGVAYLAGQVADDAMQDIRGQTKQVLTAVDTLLHRAGSDKCRILMAQIFLADLADFPAMNEVWEDNPGHATHPDAAQVLSRLHRARSLSRVSPCPEVGALCRRSPCIPFGWRIRPPRRRERRLYGELDRSGGPQRQRAPLTRGCHRTLG